MEHFCAEHNCKFYENHKGDKTWWSHKISTGGYCNEKKAEPKPDVPPEIEKGAPEKPKIKEPDYKSPVNRSVSLSYVTRIVEAMLGAGILKSVTDETYDQMMVRAEKFAQWMAKGD